MTIAPISPFGQVSTGIQTQRADVAGFSQVMSGMMSGTARALKDAENVSALGLQGAMPVHAVVEQVRATERSFQATLAVRDKIVGAYVELSRMTI